MWAYRDLGTIGESFVLCVLLKWEVMQGYKYGKCWISGYGIPKMVVP